MRFRCGSVVVRLLIRNAAPLFYGCHICNIFRLFLACSTPFLWVLHLLHFRRFIAASTLFLWASNSSNFRAFTGSAILVLISYLFTAGRGQLGRLEHRGRFVRVRCGFMGGQLQERARPFYGCQICKICKVPGAVILASCTPRGPGVVSLFFLYFRNTRPH